MRTRTRLQIFLVAVFALLYSGCSGLHFRQNSVVRTVSDPNGGTRVHVTFEVWDGDEQLTGLSREAFTVHEDGQPATSESLSAAGSDEIKPPVVLLLDTSYSMYLANAVPDLKRAANKFKKVLTDNGFTVEVFRFANKIEPVADIEDIPEKFDEKVGERFTSLYAAVQKGFSFKRDAIVVAFSDGADNFSKSHGVASLGAIETFVLPPNLQGNGNMRIVHSIAFGDFESERDKDGLPALQALQRISRNGSLSSARDKGALDAVFNDVAQRIRNVYVFEYLSPNTSGEHVLQIAVRARGSSAKSTPMKYVAGGSLGGAPGVAATGQNNPMMMELQRLCAEGRPGACKALEMQRQGRGGGAGAPSSRHVVNGVPVGPETFQKIRKLQELCGGGDEAACVRMQALAEKLMGGAPGALGGGANSDAKVRELGQSCTGGDEGACIELRQHLKKPPIPYTTAVGIQVAKEVAATKPEWIQELDKDCDAGAQNACQMYWGVEKPAGLGVQFSPSLEVTLVQPGGAAGKVGIQLGDVLFAVDGAQIEGMTRLQQMNAIRGADGSKVKIMVKRGNEKLEFLVTRETLK